MAAREKRQTRTVIVADRVVAPDHERREWELAKDLICWRVPAGFDGISHPVLIVVDNPSHLMALQSYGVALAHMASVHPDDLTPGRTDHRARMAWAAQAKAGDARNVIIDAWEKGTLPPGVATLALERLSKRAGYVEPFSQSWAIASLAYAPMAVNSLRGFENASQIALFGADARSPDLVAQDRKRARDYYRRMVDGIGRVAPDQPAGSLTIPLTEKLLSTVLPELLNRQGWTRSVDITDLEIVTRPGRRVSTKKPDSQDGKPAERSTGAIPRPAFPPGRLTYT